MYLYLKVLFFSLLSYSTFVQGQSIVNGILLEKGTLKPLKDVSIFILPHKTKVTSNENGSFSFENVPAGDCTIVINLTGYEKLEKNIDCKKNQDLNFYLEKKFYTSFETTVVGKIAKRDDQGQSLTQEEFIKAPGSFGGDPVRAAQNLPGVAVSGGSAQIIIQGSSPEDTGYLINGHRVPLIFHFGGLSSVVIPEAVERVELLPGGYGPEYSRAIGGIVGLKTKNPKNDRVHGMAYMDLLNAGGLVEGPIDEKSSFFFSGRYSYIGQVLKAVAKKNDNFELTAAPTFLDFTAIYNSELNEKNEFKTTFVASRDQLDFILNRPINNDPNLRGGLTRKTDFFRIIPQLTTQLSEKHKLDNSISIGKDKIFFNVSGKGGDIDSNAISQRSELISEWRPTYKTYLGLDNQWDSTDVYINLPTSFEAGGVRTPFSVGEEQKFRIRQTETLLGAYLRQEIKTYEDSKWTYLPNLRVDHFTVSKETHLQPRFQLRYQSDPSLLLRSALGKYVQTPKPQEISRLYGNSHLRSPYAVHYMVGFTKDFREGSSQGIEFTNNFYYKELKDLVVSDLNQRYSNAGTGKIYGGEVQAKYRKNEWTAQVVYTYLKSTRNIPGFGTQSSEFDQTHNLNLIGSYNKERWSFSSRLRFASGLPYTPVVGATFDSDNDVYIPSVGSIYSKRFGAFTQLDFRIDKKIIYERWILTAYLDIQNIMNSKNEQSIQYNYDYTDSTRARGLPILPTFGIKGEF